MRIYYDIIILDLIDKISTYRKLEAKTSPKDNRIQLFNGVFYHGREPFSPQVL